MHGAFATSGPSNLHAAAYFPDLTALYGFLSRDLVGLGIAQPELRTELVQQVASHRVRDQLGRFGGTRLTTGASLVGAIKSEELQADEIRRLSHAELFYVSPEMTDLTMAAAGSLPFFALNREDLPAEQGLMVFAKPVVTYPNEEGRPEAQIRACCWMVAEHDAMAELLQRLALVTAPHIGELTP
ncbi:hypothetical protein ABZ656_38770 [Streptomyces sp. NPDC007095]|uniref:hypothetical protein n=1 Tax=Streptomyces sp. NPDC007095 TaxID=3154482 RepID=UPI0033CD7A56